MILIFGGTTEGRICATVCEEAQQAYYYSTKTEHQEIDLKYGIHITGGLSDKEIITFCNQKSIQLVIDAAHPFAEILHENIDNATVKLNIPVIRYERIFPPRANDLIWLKSFQEALTYLERQNIDRLLALTGVNTIIKLKPYWKKHHTWFRILDRADSKALAMQAGYPLDQLVYYQKGADDKILMEELAPQAIITKESGESGGFQEKIQAARDLNIPILVVERPSLSTRFIIVHGQYGLRKTIESLLPSFFELKIGYTTGSCATAATKAALISLLSKEKIQKVNITLPSGELIYIPVSVIEQTAVYARASVIKDAGDDPDITHGKEIVAQVQLNLNHKGVRFLQGIGVGVVTLPGLDIPIGQPAINKTPRMMMKREVFKVMRHFEEKLPYGLKTGVDITISVPEGEILAQKTFNPRLGICGGISIIGTSGVVKPFSSDAFIRSIRREMQVAKALQCEHLVINSGAKSEKYLKQIYPSFRENAFIHYGNFIGESIRMASELGFTTLSLGVMIGKAVKLAEGYLDTHSKKVIMNKDFLVEIAHECNYDEEVISAIREIRMARQLWNIIPQQNPAFFHSILKKCRAVCQPLFPSGDLKIYLITEEGNVIE